MGGKKKMCKKRVLFSVAVVTVLVVAGVYGLVNTRELAPGSDFGVDMGEFFI